MSSAAIKAESSAEPDPASTSLPNDQPIDSKAQEVKTASVTATTNMADDKTIEEAKAQVTAEESKTQQGKESGEDESAKAATEGKLEDKTSEQGDTVTDKTEVAKQTGHKESPKRSNSYDRKDKHSQDNRRTRDNRNHRNHDNRNYRNDRDNKPTEDYSKNVKTDFTQLPISSDHDEIRKQVEFYFSDSNLPRDRFLFNKVGGATNNPVPIDVICSFKRMRRFKPLEEVIAALKKSEFLEILNDDKDIRRKTPLDKSVGTRIDDNMRRAMDELTGVYEDVARPRSIYAKGFGKETRTTQFDIESFFEPYGPAKSVRLRRNHPEKMFKGSVFVEFDSEEIQKAFLALDPKPKWEDKELLIMSKQDYCDLKLEEIKNGDVQPNNREANEHKSDRRGSGGRFVTCYNCGEEGHTIRDCTNERKSSNDGGRFVTCHNCGVKGHKSRECTEERKSTNGGGRDRNDWKGRRDDFQRSGFRDEHRRNDRDRGGARGDNRGRRDERKNHKFAGLLNKGHPDQPRDENGIPQLITTSPPTSETNGAAGGKKTPDKKRAREEDGEGAEGEKSEAKKAKVGEGE